ncbi:MAG: hypothetical protein NUV42_00165 [Candidatus Yonathbacteria bacterium]|nr:hypothetical protein [Candidatus Yonathbacteria bacterium]
MSRYASLAFAHLEMANVALEDLLLMEMSSTKGDISNVQNQLESSRQNIIHLIDTAQRLKDEMNHRGYRDPVTICPVDLDAIGTALVKDGLVNAEAWHKVAKNARSGGFYANLAMIHEQALSLAEYTDKLSERVEGLRKHAKDGTIMRVLEENLSGNLKPEFAKLYNTWIRFQAYFLASSLLSTEVHYAFNGYDSLASVATQTSAA